MHWSLLVEPADAGPPLAAARGILLAGLLSSVLWVGLVLTVRTLW